MVAIGSRGSSVRWAHAGRDGDDHRLADGPRDRQDERRRIPDSSAGTTTRTAVSNWFAPSAYDPSRRRAAPRASRPR